MRSIDPFTNESGQTYQDHTETEVKQIINDVANAWLIWKKTSFEARKNYLLKLEGQLIHDQEHLAGVMVNEMGKVRREALGEIKKCAWGCRYYAENGYGRELAVFGIREFVHIKTLVIR